MGAARRAGPGSSTRPRPPRCSGPSEYLGGWVDPRGGAIQPLSLCPRPGARRTRRRRRASTAAAPCRHARSNGSLDLTTAQGAKRRRRAASCCAPTATRGDLWPGLRADRSSRRTRSRSPRSRCSDNLRTHRSCRRASVVGHAPAAALFPARPTSAAADGRPRPVPRAHASDADWATSNACRQAMFPAAAEDRDRPIAGADAWRSTRDFLPHLHEPAPGPAGRHRLQGARHRPADRDGTRDRRLSRQRPGCGAAAAGEPAFAACRCTRLRRLYISAIVAWYRLRGGGLA